jgi:hypothetical protein
MTESYVIIPWEEFLKKSSIEKTGHDKWCVRFEDQIFEITYESFVMYPLSLQGATAFRLEKIKPKDAKESWRPYWEIYVRADLREYPDEEILRVVWSHLGRTEGDENRIPRTLYEYDRLDKSIPEGAIGEPKEMAGGIKRWKISRPLGHVIVETYVYVAADGKPAGDVILVETTNGYKWEISTDCSRYNSLQAAERKILKSLRTP